MRHRGRTARLRAGAAHRARDRRRGVAARRHRADAIGSAGAVTGATRYLPVAGDPEGEFCGQHHVTVTPAGSVLMFDNGNHCLGPRKGRDPVTRIVEYDVSSGTEARFVREYREPEGALGVPSTCRRWVFHDNATEPS